MMPWINIENKVVKVLREIGCRITKEGNDLIVNDQYKFNLPTSWFTNLRTGEKGRGLSELRDIISNEQEEQSNGKSTD